MLIRKITVAIIIILLMATIGIVASYYGSGYLLNFLSINDIKPSFNTAYILYEHGNKQTKFAASIFLLLSNGLPILLTLIFMYVIFAPDKRGLYGDAKLANKSDLVKAGLLPKGNKKIDEKYPSIIVGKLNKSFLLFSSMQSVYLAAPTRSGKGVGVVIPNSLHYRDSMVILDIKSEIFTVSAGFRKKCGQEIHRFSPDDEDFNTSHWNPLDYVRPDKRFLISDLMSITKILYPSTDEVWNATAESLFLGIALYICETKKEAGNLNIKKINQYATLLDFLASAEKFSAYIKSRKDTEPLSDECISYLKKYTDGGDKTKNSILITFNKPIQVFTEPVTANATKKSTFDLTDIRKKRMTIYICISPKNIGKFDSLLNLFFSQALSLNMDELPEHNKALKYQCLFLMDEFPIMGGINIIKDAAAFMAGYNLRLLLVFQSKSQLKQDSLYGIYGTNTLLTNMALQIIFAPREQDDAKEYAELLGTFTAPSKSTSRKANWGGSDKSITSGEASRALFLPQEIKEIGEDKAFVSLENMKPALIDKVYWYKEGIFKSRANLPVPSFINNYLEELVVENSIEQIQNNDTQASVDITKFSQGEAAMLNFVNAKIGA